MSFQSITITNSKDSKDCLFNPSLPKRKSDNGKCPDGSFQNEDDNCFPQHDKYPKGYHSHENDETGRCIPDLTPCEPGSIIDPDIPTCSQKECVCSKHPELEACGTHLIIIIKKIIHSSNSGSSNSGSSHSLSKGCFAIKIGQSGKIHTGQNQEVNNFIDKCLSVHQLARALLTYQRIDFLGLLLPQRRTASIVSLGLVLRHIFEDGGAF